MTRTLGLRRRALHAVLLSLLAATALLVPRPGPAAAAAPLTVAQAIATQNSSTATVRGYVVGQPTATSTVVTSGFPNDYAIALADAPGTSATSQMVYVQVPTAFRASFGLRSNPSLMGKQVDVTGTLTAYFSHPGLKDGTDFALTGSGGGDGGGDGGGGTDPSIPAGYYDPAAGKTGAALAAALHGIIDGNRTLSYTQVWDALKVTDADPANSNNVIEFYSGRSVPKSTNGGDADDWNREHTWPQSHGDFGTSAGPGTDLHHLRPEDVTVNSTRGNKDFDNGGSAVAQCPDCFSDADSFEPRDSVKGDVARGLMYMAVRYEGGDGFADLELNDSINGTTPYLGKISVLLAWSAADPPTAAERARNDRIYRDYQGNRNPFVDHPEYAEAIW
ncbi:MULTISPECIES: endonuclease [unclassified Nocardioides]|uniref:endonuclease n=1 Tax=unclassified Nocardioides TaxID=2615069 RepID=UPI0011539D41|nr:MULTISPECIES: endonuclease [unclassified Nocardioides]TQK70535.1 endonuclease I [Nocardioides sp. SLBN-35]WGY00073.1 endonuclease [Nocardioides sp. QY071]